MCKISKEGMNTGCSYNGHNFGDHEVVSIDIGMGVKAHIAICPSDVVTTSVGLFYKITSFNQMYLESNRTWDAGLLHSADGHNWSFVNSALEIERIFNSEKFKVMSMLETNAYAMQHGR